MPEMLVDVHTHVFPPRMVAGRAALLAADAGFAELYASPAARMATADDLLVSMDASGVDVSVAAGFWWRSDQLADEHARYLIESAARSDGRIVPFVPAALGAPDARARLRRLAAEGARGLGEVRPGNQPLGITQLDAMLGWVGEELGLPVLLHLSEEVGHRYPGKAGGYSLGQLWFLLESQPAARVIAAHWGGGFPFYALMPEVRALLDAGRLAFDSAASPLLYQPEVFAQVVALAGEAHVLWGSDFPLRDQLGDRRAVEAALPEPAQRDAVLGGNAARLLGLRP